MSAPETMPLEEVIAALRTVKAPTRRTPSVAQLRRLIDDVSSLLPLANTLARAEFAEFTAADVISFAEEFGKHRARVLKRQLDKPMPQAHYESSMILPFSQQEKAAINALRASGKRVPKHLAAIDPQELVTTSAYLPVGYEKGAGHGRDIGKSIAAVVAKPVDDAEIIRFVERQYGESTTLLDADHVQLLHWVASNGLAEKLLELGGLRVERADGKRTLVRSGGANTPLVRLLVEAYDLLEVARLDALDGVTQLVAASAQARARGPEQDASALDVAGLRAAAAKARLLAPAEIGRLDKLAAEVERTPGNARLAEILRTRVANFALWVRSNPSTFAVTGVDKLTSAHLAQILAGSGLLADEADDKAVSAELRARLTEMGLVNDLDREIPEGLRAFKLGKLEEFYSSRQARVDGDPDWKLLYEAAAVLEELQTV